MIRFIQAILAFTLIPFMAQTSWSTFSDLTTPVPISRLIKNVSEYVQKNPEDAHGYYTLGRLHSYAFAKEEIEKPLESVFVLSEILPRFAPWESIYLEADKEQLSDKQKSHLLESVHYYFIAARKNPDRGLYFLGLAWMLEQGAPYAKELKWPRVYSSLDADHKANHSDYLHEFIEQNTKNGNADDGPGIPYLKKHITRYTYCILDIWNKTDAKGKSRLSEFLPIWWREFALEMYRRAYSLSIHYELKEKSVFNMPQNQVGVEAGRAIIRLLDNYPDSPEKSWEIELIEKSIQIAASGFGAITPIVFSLSPNNSLHSRLDTQSTVSFDLDGFGAANYPWVKPDTAILVWDPERGGKITSGRQLFGSVTWWMFWRDGYEAMASLDDDDNGWLEEVELNGLALWQDRNSNGVSDSGEVTPIEQTEVEKLSVHPSTRRGWTIECHKGLILHSGEVLPTYDWIVEKK